MATQRTIDNLKHLAAALERGDKIEVFWNGLKCYAPASTLSISKNQLEWAAHAPIDTENPPRSVRCPVLKVTLREGYEAIHAARKPAMMSVAYIFQEHDILWVEDYPQ